MFDANFHSHSPLLDPRQARNGIAPSRHALNRQRYCAGKTARLAAEAAERRRAGVDRVCARISAGLRWLAGARGDLVSAAMDRLHRHSFLKTHPERRPG